MMSSIEWYILSGIFSSLGLGILIISQIILFRWLNRFKKE